VLPVQPRRTGEGPEADARAVRHDALERERVRSGAVAVLYGHHADDQAETLLLRLARGTGTDGLGGMRTRSGSRVRPLLRVRRTDLHAVCREEGIAATHDPTNDDDRIRRVRLRGEVLPALGRIGPDPVAALVRLAAIARDESDLLDTAARTEAAALPVLRLGHVSVMPSDGLRALHPALARRLLRHELMHVTGSRRAPDAVDVERALSAVDRTRLTLPGPVDLEVSRGWHLLRQSQPAPASPVGLGPEVGASSVHWRATGWMLERLDDPTSGTVRTAAPVPTALPPGLDRRRMRVTLRSTRGPLSVRARRDGDRVRTPVGTRSLADVMGGAGVLRGLRDLLPVLVDEHDEVVWVPGLVVSERHRAPDGRDGHDARDGASTASTGCIELVVRTGSDIAAG